MLRTRVTSRSDLRPVLRSSVVIDRSHSFYFLTLSSSSLLFKAFARVYCFAVFTSVDAIEVEAQKTSAYRKGLLMKTFRVC